MIHCIIITVLNTPFDIFVYFNCRSLISTAAFPEVTSLPVMSEVEISSLSIVAANLSDQFISGNDLNFIILFHYFMR